MQDKQTGQVQERGWRLTLGPPDTVEGGCLIKRARMLKSRLGRHVDWRVLLGEFAQITLVVSGLGARAKSLRKTVFGVVSCTPNRRGHQGLFLHKFHHNFFKNIFAKNFYLIFLRALKSTIWG